MKKYLFLLFVIALGAPAFAQETKQQGPVITFEQRKFDFGDIKQGDRVEHTFVFTNTGTEPLIITNVEVTCGCTTPKGFTRDPIAPGGKSEIIVAFNSAGKLGRQNKVVTVVSNAVNTQGHTIEFTANVLQAIQ
jgi:Protein of unknown function (DUF1573)